MAFRLFGTQTVACIGGFFNSNGASQDTWSNPFANATALTVTLTMKPDSPFNPNLNPAANQPGQGELIHLYGGFSYENLFRVWHLGNGQVVFDIYDNSNGGTGLRECVTVPGTLVAGQWNRLVFRWQASPEKMTVWNNGAPVSVGLGGTQAAHLTLQTSSFYAPFEIGAVSGTDWGQLIGSYAEAAAFTSYWPDADAAAYGTGVLASQLTQTGRQRYVTLGSFFHERQANQFPIPYWHMASFTDVFTGEQYGETLEGNLPTNGNWGALVPMRGVFDQFALAPHPPPAGGFQGNWWDDPQHLPQRGFEPWELQHELGRRTGHVIRVPQDQPSLQNAMNVAAPGDQILLDHTVTQNITFNMVMPNLTKTPTTLRVPPVGRTRLTGATPLTG